MNKMILFIKKYWQTILLVVGILFGFLFIGHYNKIQSQDTVLKQNIHALTDTIHVLQSKNGEYISKIQSYTGKVSELKKYSEELYSKLEDYRKSTSSKPQTIVTTQTEVVFEKGDTVYILSPTEIVYLKEFDFSNKYRTLTGRLFVNDSIASVEIDPEHIYADFTAGLDENNNVFIMTDNPYVQITNLKGYTVERPRTKHWGIGLQAGIGLGIKNLNIQPYIGIGISYNLIIF